MYPVVQDVHCAECLVSGIASIPRSSKKAIYATGR